MALGDRTNVTISWREYFDGICYSGDNEIVIGVDVDQLNELASFLEQKASSVNDCCFSMFGIIDAMENGVWSGKVYDAFKAHGKQYQDALVAYASNISLYAKIFRKVASQGEVLIEDVKSKASF